MAVAQRWRRGGVAALLVVMLAACGPVPGDFVPDGRSEIWYTKHTSDTTESWFAYGDPNTPVAPVTGTPLHGDFDGDGLAEPASAKWDGANNWYSATRGYWTFPPPPWTQTGPWVSYPDSPRSHQIPVPLRWKGNVTKAAWYRDSDATWHIEGEPAPIQFGIGDDGVLPNEQDFPTPGDFNGDGQDELAVYHPLTGTFEIQGDPTEIHVGGETWGTVSLPVVGDFDGDGRDDFAATRFKVVGYGGYSYLAIAGQPDGPPISIHGPQADPLMAGPVLGDFSDGPGLDVAWWAYPNKFQYENASGTMTTIEFEPGATTSRYALGLQFNVILASYRLKHVAQYCSTAPEC